MKLKVGWIGKTKDPAIQALTAEYLKRLRHYAESEGMTFVNEDAMLKYRDKVGTRPAHSIVLLDSRGKQLSSEEFAGSHQPVPTHEPETRSCKANTSQQTERTEVVGVQRLTYTRSPGR